MRFTDELARHVDLGAVLEDLLGEPLKRDRETSIRCVNARAHANGDKNPSASVSAKKGLYHCFACGLKGDVVDLVRELRGLASAEDAIRWLREKYMSRSADASSSNRAPQAAPAREEGEDGATDQAEFPFHPDAIKQRGWMITRWRGTALPAIEAPIYDADFELCGWKIRGPRRPNGKVRACLSTTDTGRRQTGLIDGHRLQGLAPGSLVFVVGGETDLAKFTDAANRIGRDLVAVCHSNGEDHSFEALAKCFRHLDVIVVLDTDKTGRKGAATICSQLQSEARWVFNLELPFTDREKAEGRNDLRDWLGPCGNSLQALLDTIQAKRPRVRTGTNLLRDLDAGLLEPRPTLIEGLLKQRDILVVFGPAGLGKSQLSLALCVCLALGGDAVPYVIPDVQVPQWAVADPTPRRVLLFSAEDDEFDTATRLKEYLDALGVPSDLEHLIVATPRDAERDLTTGSGVRFLESLVAAHRPEVVVIDNLTTVLPGLDKSSDSEVSMWMDRVPRMIRDRYLCTLVLLGHANKPGSREDARAELDRLFGSYVWGAAADGAVMLDRVKGRPDQRKILHAKARGIPLFDTMTVQAPKGDCVFSLIDTRAPGAAAERKLKVSLDELKAAIRTRQDTDDERVPRNSLLETLNHLRAETGDPTTVGRTALENALKTYGADRAMGIRFEPGAGRGDPWVVWIEEPERAPGATQ